MFLYFEVWSRDTRHCCSSHVVIYLLAHLLGVGQQPGLQLPHLPQDLPSASQILRPDEYLTLVKGTSFFCRTPTSSKLEVVRQ